MKKILSLMAVLALGALTAEAEDFNLYYVASDGTVATQKWEVNKLQKITFEEGKMALPRTFLLLAFRSWSSIPRRESQALKRYKMRTKIKRRRKCMT